MGENVNNKSIAQRKPNKTTRVGRIVSLFEISRPNKHRSLQRTNSLPAQKKPATEETNIRHSFGQYSSINKVQKIKEEIEEKGKQNHIPPTPKPARKKRHSSASKFEGDRTNKMEDINKLQDRIEDVSRHIEDSDTELEVTHRRVPFEDSDRDTDTPFNRLSSDTVLDILSSYTIKENSEDDESIENYVSYREFVRAASVEEEKDDIRRNDVNEYISDESNPTEQVFDNEQTEEKPEESHAVEELDDNAMESEPLEPEEQENFNDTTEVDSIQWWKHKSFVQINNDNSSKTVNSESSSSSSTTARRFVKNNSSIRNRRVRRRTGILQKPFTVKDLAGHFEGFKEAAENGQTESFRRSLIDEMDKEMENMKNDGFGEDLHLSFENLTLLDYEDDDSTTVGEYDGEEGATNDCENEESPVFQTIMIFPNTALEENTYEETTPQDPEDLFGEQLFSEGLENGLYYLEAYNADGKELIMCSVQIDRQSVDLNSFDEIKDQSISSLLQDENTLILMDAAESSSLNESKSGSDSKRNTIYSTTSGESFDDEENSSSSYGYSAARRETYCDNLGIVRIERIAPYLENGEKPPDYINTTNNYYHDEVNNGEEGEEGNYYESIRLEHEIMFSVPEVKKETLQYILEEIKTTERKYVSDMWKVIAEYKTFLEERCPEKVDVVFANMDQIYSKQLDFLQTLEESEAEIKEVVQAFIDFEDLWRLYPRYFRNTPKANNAVKDLGFLFKEKQDRINDKLNLSAYLLTPLQRLGKYKLFLENIIKQFEKEQKPTGAVQMALDIIKKYMSRGNDAVAIASILHSPLHTKDYGSFITREKFVLLKPKRLELMVFLFEGAVVFTTEDPKNMEQFVYHQSIKTIDLRIATFDDTTIHLTDFTKTKRRNSSKYTYVLDAKNYKLKAAWKKQIEEILWKQMQKIKENTIKEYQNGNKTTETRTVRSREQRSKSTGSSIFYVA